MRSESELEAAAYDRVRPALERVWASMRREFPQVSARRMADLVRQVAGHDTLALLRSMSADLGLDDAGDRELCRAMDMAISRVMDDLLTEEAGKN